MVSGLVRSPRVHRCDLCVFLCFFLSFLIIPRSAIALVAVEAEFATDDGGFAYEDDVFRGSGQPTYASGTWLSSGGYLDGCLSVDLGGINNTPISVMSGGWWIDFSLATDEELELTMRYNLTQSADYESDEISQVMVDIDGTLIGTGRSEYVAEMKGDGNGSGVRSTGWRIFQYPLGMVSAGPHRLTVGGYNNKKSNSSEWTTILIDEIKLQTPAESILQLSESAIVEELSLTSFIQNIATLADFQTRHWSQSQNMQAVDWAQLEFESYGYDVERHSYLYSGQYRDNLFVTKIGSVHPDQIPDADMDIEYQSGAASASYVGDSIDLATALFNGNLSFSESYSAEVSSNMNNTDSVAFQAYCPTVSVRENKRIGEIGSGGNPNWHKSSDVIATYSSDDFNLGFSITQMTAGGVATLAHATVHVCGDGIVVSSEACDDGGLYDGDGCSASCTIEPGYDCLGQPSLCSEVCGDGIVTTHEHCDDNNRDDNDCCSSLCQFESDGSVCNDGNSCMENDRCLAGACDDVTLVPDTDLDGVCDSVDLCPDLFDPTQLNGDNDLRGDLCDCLPEDETIWAIPSPAIDLQATRAGNTTLMSWNPPAVTGCVNPLYDTLRSSNPAHFDDTDVTQCLETDDASDRNALDPETPPPGFVYYYLVRPENNCGAGSCGTDSDNAQRSARSCP